MKQMTRGEDLRQLRQIKQSSVARATLGRLPLYLEYLKSSADELGAYVSATSIAKALSLGDVQVRKDLNAVCGTGKPKVGYRVSDLVTCLEDYLGFRCLSKAVIVGAGKLGTALLEHEGFKEYGIEISAAFDSDPAKLGISSSGKEIYHIDLLDEFCRRENIRIGIITVPSKYAQDVCNMLVESGVTAIWDFAPGPLEVPSNVLLHQENLALSLAHLNMLIANEAR